MSDDLHHALYTKDMSAVRRLLRDKADPTAVNRMGKGLLYTAVQYGVPEAVPLLLDAGAQPGEELAYNPLIEACLPSPFPRTGMEDTVRRLYWAGAALDQRDSKGRTAIESENCALRNERCKAAFLAGGLPRELETSLAGRYFFNQPLFDVQLVPVVFEYLDGYEGAMLRAEREKRGLVRQRSLRLEQERAREREKALQWEKVAEETRLAERASQERDKKLKKKLKREKKRERKRWKKLREAASNAKFSAELKSEERKGAEDIPNLLAPDSPVVPNAPLANASLKEEVAPPAPPP